MKPFEQGARYALQTGDVANRQRYGGEHSIASRERRQWQDGYEWGRKLHKEVEQRIADMTELPERDPHERR